MFVQVLALQQRSQVPACVTVTGGEVKVSRSCPTLCDPMDYTDHGILHTRILEWVAIPFSKGWSQPRDQIHVFCVACFGRRVTTSATWGTLSP